MQIVGFRGSYRNFPFPSHPDFQLKDFGARELINPDAYIQTSVAGVAKTSNNNQYSYIRKRGKPVYVVEQAIFRQNLNMKQDKDTYLRFGLNHYDLKNGYFANHNSPDDRWKQIQKDQDIEIKPWRTKGDYILILLQNPIDTSLNSMVQKIQYGQWLVNLVRDIRKITDEDILIRPHPLFINRIKNNGLNGTKQYKNVRISDVHKGTSPSNGGDNLAKDLEKARVCISYTSNSLTEAICEGIPSISLSDECFAWPVSYHNLDILKDRSLVCNIDRTQWLHDCAYAQWKLSEINSGIPHRRLLNGNRA